MKNAWLIKKFATLTGVSVRALHHYDRIGVLKPSIRQSNGYRLYSHQDLLRLQQIVALKYFGMELSQIQQMLSGKVDAYEHLSMQSNFLEEKAQTLMRASQTLRDVIQHCTSDKSVSLENILELIEVYKMAEKFEHEWVRRVLKPDEIRQYAEFEAGLKSRFTPEEKKHFEEEWGALTKKMETQLDCDPSSESSMMLAAKVMELVNVLYGPEYANLRQSIWENGYKKNNMEDEHQMSPKMVAWLDKALDCYWRKQIYDLLREVSKRDITQDWEMLMTSMYGHHHEPKKELVDVALTDENVREDARRWLKLWIQR